MIRDENLRKNLGVKAGASDEEVFAVLRTMKDNF